jgi:hypothetical protein
MGEVDNLKFFLMGRDKIKGKGAIITNPTVNKVINT